MRCLSHFSHCWDKIADTRKLQEEIFLLIHSLWKVQSLISWAEGHGGEKHGRRSRGQREEPERETDPSGPGPLDSALLFRPHGLIGSQLSTP